MNCRQWVVDAVLLGAGALTLEAGDGLQVTGHCKISAPAAIFLWPVTWDP